MAKAIKSSDRQKPDENEVLNDCDHSNMDSMPYKDNTVKKVFVSNLSGKVNKRHLQNIFSAYGRIESSNLKKTRGNISAEITFVSPSDALKAQEAATNKAIKCNGKVLNAVLVVSNSQDSRRKRIWKKPSTENQKGNKDNELDQFNFINCLDDDCLIQIFLKLSIFDRLRIERVCKRWQNVATQAWRDLKSLHLTRNLYDENPTVNLRLINNQVIEKILMRCGRYLSYLELSTYDLSQCDSDVLFIIGEQCHNLDKLSLQLKRYTSKNVNKVFSQIKKMRCLEIDEIGRDFTNHCLLGLPNRAFKELHLSARCTRDDFSSETIRLRLASTFLRKFKNLSHLTLNGFTLKSEKVKIISQCKTLTHLSLANCYIKKGNFNIFNLHNLQYLNLQKVCDVSNDFLTSLATYCTNLKHLDISHCENVTNSGIAALAKLSSLKVLFMDGLYVVDNVIADLIYIETLHCEDCDMIRDDGVCTLIATAPNLTFLNLANCSVTAEVLSTANQVTKKRTNNLMLTIVVSSVVTLEWNLEDLSPLLIVDIIESSTFDNFSTDCESEYLDFDEYFDDDDDELMSIEESSDVELHPYDFLFGYDIY